MYVSEAHLRGTAWPFLCEALVLDKANSCQQRASTPAVTHRLSLLPTLDLDDIIPWSVNKCPIWTESTFISYLAHKIHLIGKARRVVDTTPYETVW